MNICHSSLVGVYTPETGSGVTELALIISLSCLFGCSVILSMISCGAVHKYYLRRLKQVTDRVESNSPPPGPNVVYEEIDISNVTGSVQCQNNACYSVVCSNNT
jgi:hypothetical protein